MNVFYIICEVLFLIGFSVIFSLNFFIYNKITVIDSQYTISLARNWLNSPILDISLGPKCSEGYSIYIFDYWPGTLRGCICGGTFYIGGCPSKKYTTCNAISPIDPIPYKLWSSNTLCVKSIPMTSYLNLTIARKEDSCPTGQKSCGIIDSLGNILCMQTNDVCPLNDIKMFSSSETVPSGYKTLNLNQNGVIKTLAFRNSSPSGKVVVEFKVSDNTPCIDPYFYNKITNPYILEVTNERDKCIGSLGSQILDKNYNFIDYTKVYDLYNENNILPVIKDKLPLFPTSQFDLRTRLYYRNYIGLNKSCHDDIKKANLLETINNGFNFIQSNYQTFVDIYKGFYIYIIVIWSFSILCYFFARNIFYCMDSFDDCCNCILVIEEIFTFLSVLVIMVIYIVFYNQMKSLKDGYISFMKYTNCGDSAFSEAIPSFVNSIESTINLVTWNMGISIGIVICPLIHIFLLCCKRNECCNCCQEDYSEYENNMISKRNPEVNNNINNNLPYPVINMQLPQQGNNVGPSDQQLEMYRKIDPPINNNDIDVPNEDKNMIHKNDSLKGAPPIIEPINDPNNVQVNMIEGHNQNLPYQNNDQGFNSAYNQQIPAYNNIYNNNLESPNPYYNNIANNNSGNQFNSVNNLPPSYNNFNNIPNNNNNYPQQLSQNIPVSQQEVNKNNQPNRYD